MRFYVRTTACCVALAVSLAAAGSAAAKPSAERSTSTSGDVPRAALAKLVELGIERHELDLSAARTRPGRARSTSRRSSAASRRRSSPSKGIELTPKEIDGQTVTQRATAQVAAGTPSSSKYSGPGGLKEEFEQIARRHPLMTKLVNDRQDHQRRRTSSR